VRLETLRLKNFKSFRDVELKGIPPLCVVVGANGTGKSTLFSVFAFLQDCFRSDVKKALQARGGFKEVLSRGVDLTESICIEIQFRLEIKSKKRLVTYLVEIGEENGKIIVRREILRYKRGASGMPFHFIDFKRGKGDAVTDEENYDKPDTELTREEQTVAPDHLAISGLGQFQRFKAAYAFQSVIENWHISDFHIDQARGIKNAIGDDDHLSSSGDNLQLVARRIYENHSKVFSTILKKMKSRVPGVSDVIPKLTEDGRLLLQFQDGAFKDQPFIDRWVSDGTIKMFAYLVLLHDPEPHPLLCVEEPENQLYPRLLPELAEEFRAYASNDENGQVLVSTHSPEFLNALRLNEVIWLVKRNGYTEIKKAVDDLQIKAYMEAGDQMGYLWEQGFFHDVDPR
jgi:predicted ATPase